MNMKRDWLEFARRLAEGARAKLAEDRQRLEAKAPRVKSRGLIPVRQLLRGDTSCLHAHRRGKRSGKEHADQW
jgi:hypothetical protein